MKEKWDNLTIGAKLFCGVVAVAIVGSIVQSW